MKEFEHILASINKTIKKEATNFVYYDKLGEIRKISNSYKKIENLDCVEVPHNAVKSIVVGKHKASDYVVIFDKNTKEITVKAKQKNFTANRLFYQIPKSVFLEEEFISSFNIKNQPTVSKKAIYENIFVDVWYNELEHLEGQHIWYNKNIYKMLKYQEKNTVFSKNNAEIILEDVKLFDDENKELYFDKNLSNNDLFLSNNKLYMYKNNSSIIDDIDVLIIQNVKNYKWQVFLSDNIQRTIKQNHKSNLHRSFILSVTDLNDPNILYRTLNLQINDLILSKQIEIPFEYDWEKNGKSVSIFVDKYFDSYFYGVVQ